MCNRYRITAKQADLAAAMGVKLPFDEYPNLPPPELFPKRPAWVVRNTDHGRAIDVMTWGFPHLVATPKSGKMVEKAVTNVRNLRSPFWRAALTSLERRCLVPVVEFAEFGPGIPGKLPLYWFSVPSRPIFALAGVWRPLANGAAFAFLTCEPNPIVAPIHPKAMPVILHEDDYDRWLTADYADAVTLAAPYPSQLMSVCCPSLVDTPAEIEVEDVPASGLFDVVAN